MTQRNIFDEISGVSLPRHWMGAWLSYRKLASVSQLPNSDYRAQLAGLYPQDYAFTFSLSTASATADQRVTIQRDWFLLGLTGFSSVNASSPADAAHAWKLQIYIGRYRQGVPLSDRPTIAIDQLGGQGASVTGSPIQGMLARFLRVPLWIPPNTPILIRAQLVPGSGSPATTEVTLQGCGR